MPGIQLEKPPRPARARSAVGLLLLAGCSAPAPGDLHRPPDAPPAPAAVRDGIGADVDRQESRGALFANWDPFVDPEGLPVVYEWCVGTHPGAADVMPWTAVGGAERAATEGVELPGDQTLFVSVRATDLAGNRSLPVTSDGVRIGADAAAPGAATGSGDERTGGSPSALLERHGVTWTLREPAANGRFANGDPWVLGPVDVVAIAPAARADGERLRNGSMSNPDPRCERQGYDSAMFGDGAAGGFDRALDVAHGVSRERPLRLLPGTSLVSAISDPAAGALPQLIGCAVLTCLAEAPPADAFRPPYCGADKTCRWRAGRLDLTRLRRLPPVAGAPDPAALAQRFARTWLDHVPGWTGRYLHPRDHMPDYGREIADLVGQAALVLQLDLPDAARRDLALALVQYGIDVHGIVGNGGRFVADGGSGSGRKFPLLLAAALLQDEALSATLRDHPLAFAEDVQTFYVAETAPGVFDHGHGGYGAEDVGLPEWGNRHADDPRHDRKAWTADPYRRCCTANAWLGYVLAARLMGLREAWGHEALFDYVDRYLQIEPKHGWTRAFSPFAERMWDRYRRDC